MRFRVVVVLCLFAAYSAVGCRQAIAPPEDNKPPETWITAAPFDTITLVKNQDPVPERIPVRFHVYWAGSDQDGAVSGFFWAVTETLPTALDGFTTPPELPGPKPQDYHFIAKTDSFFIFNVAENIPDRQHAFFIYSVDNKGKPDPTPARFIFNAIDNYPPRPQFLESKAFGTVYAFNSSGVLVAEQREYNITDVDAGATGRAPRDTVPANATLSFKWTGNPAIPGSVIAGYRYRLDEPDFSPLSNATQVKYNSHVGSDSVPPAPGTKLFLLRALDQAGGSLDSTRFFQLNFSPDTWFSGPDPNGPAWRVKSNGEHWAYNPTLGSAGLIGSLLSPDSTLILPALRTPRRTFIEFWNDTLFLRFEGDTLHMNSYAVVHNGGFDRDSPYLVRVSALGATLPGFPGGIVLKQDQFPNGSPIGFRSRIVVLQSPEQDGYISTFSQSGLYPLFDPNDVFDLPRIAIYHPQFISGRTYVLSKSEDGDGARDQRVDDPRQLVEDVESGNATPEEIALRPLVLTFYVNKTPYFRTDNPLFTPLPGHVYTDLNWNLVLPAFDPDPFQNGTPRGNSSSTQ